MKNYNTIVEKIAKYLRHEITYSKLNAGQHIKESQIWKEFNVSRVPVREAFRILQSEGYIEMIPNKGSYVKKISREYILQTAKVYRLLAPVVLEKAIPRYTKNTYKKADSLINKIHKCTDFSKIGYLLWDFAIVIYSPSQMKFILSIFEDIYKHSIRVLNEIFENESNAKFKIDTHRKFIELCKNNKKDEAINLWINFIDQIKVIVLLDKPK
ncbi:MAG: GntR family transcriptional regulator [Bacteroidota bacterium]|nr:GntR family transcriptional regulator [Bacteroidota bacterium]